MNKYFRLIELFIGNDDISRNNANFVRGIPVLEHVVVGEVMKDYLFDVIYKGLPVRTHHEEGWAYHHQTYRLSAYCIGLSAKDIAYYGLQSNAKNERRASPPKRLETLFMQCANLICLIAQEVSGATSLNDLSTVAAGYLYHLERDGRKSYSDYELENLWQEFLYNINLPFRSGNSPFSNITLDFGKPNSRLRYEPVVYAGELLNYTYEKIPPHYFDRINTAFIKAMRKGDADGNPFTFPLITVNITEDFDRENPAWKLLLKESEYFGGFYVQNYLKEPFTKPSKYREKNPFIKPFDEGTIYSNCCLAPETEIFVYEGESSTARSLPLKEIKEKFCGRLIGKNGREEWLEVEGELFVPSVNPETGKLERKRVKRFLTVKSNKRIKVRGRNGFEFVCEPTHRVAVVEPESGRLKWKLAGELRGDEFLAVVKEADFQPVKIERIEREELPEPVEFMDIEVEDNETFVLSNGFVSFNCRMLFDISQVEAITGSNPFHSGSGVGGIGVYAINMNRLLFLAKDDFDFLKRMIDYAMEVGARALQRKREWLRKHWKDLFPYLSFYQKDDRSLFNIFSVVGVHEGMVNAGFKGGLFNDGAKEYAHQIARYLYKKLHQFMERDRVLYSLEYAPSENAACRMAEKDVAFANALAEVLNGERKPELSKDPYLNLFIKEAITKFGSELFEKVEVEDEG